MTGLLVLLLAYGVDEISLVDGLSAELAASLEPCDGLAGEARDWCAYSVLQSHFEAFGAEGAVLSDRLASPDVRGLAIELAMSSPNPPRAERCDEIADLRTRESCWIYATEPTLASARDIPHAVEICAPTGSLVVHCARHILERREPHWMAEGTFPIELALLVAALPAVKDDARFGQTVGDVSRKLTTDSDALTAACALVSAGEPREACLGRNRLPTGVQGPPIPPDGQSIVRPGEWHGNVDQPLAGASPAGPEVPAPPLTPEATSAPR